MPKYGIWNTALDFEVVFWRPPELQSFALLLNVTQKYRPGKCRGWSVNGLLLLKRIEHLYLSRMHAYLHRNSATRTVKQYNTGSVCVFLKRSGIKQKRIIKNVNSEREKKATKNTCQWISYVACVSPKQMSDRSVESSVERKQGSHVWWKGRLQRQKLKRERKRKKKRKTTEKGEENEEISVSCWMYFGVKKKGEKSVSIY